MSITLFTGANRKIGRELVVERHDRALHHISTSVRDLATKRRLRWTYLGGTECSSGITRPFANLDGVVGKNVTLEAC